MWSHPLSKWARWCHRTVPQNVCTNRDTEAKSTSQRIHHLPVDFLAFLVYFDCSLAEMHKKKPCAWGNQRELHRVER